MNIKDKLGLRVKSLRLENKISQEKLATLSNLDRTYINSIEKGERNISIETIEKISKALNIYRLLDNNDEVEISKISNGEFERIIKSDKFKTDLKEIESYIQTNYQKLHYHWGIKNKLN